MFAFFHSFRTVKVLRIKLALLGIVLLLAACQAWAQPRGVKEGEVIEAAPAVAPNIYRATAVKQDGKVMIRISARETRLRSRDADHKEAKDWIDCWTEMDPLIFEQQIRAYKPSGDRINEAAVLEALKKPVATVCFQRAHKSDPELPDPFYTKTLRDDVVILVFEAKYWLRYDRKGKRGHCTYSKKQNVPFCDSRLLDGQVSLREISEVCLPDEVHAVDILDIIHVAGYVQRAAKVFYSSAEQREAFRRQVASESEHHADSHLDDQRKHQQPQRLLKSFRTITVHTTRPVPFGRSEPTLRTERC